MMDLFEWRPHPQHGPRDGATFVPERDTVPLNKQASDVWALMCDGRWRTLHTIAEATGHPEASVSARLRDFRKARFGGHVVDREVIAHRTYRYRLVPADTMQEEAST